ncbi:MAG: hypothetical protein LLF95_08280 [Bacteroidales bacterium]|nr:hypothetical protein [Bacteroidales bacterium]
MKEKERKKERKKEKTAKTFGIFSFYFTFVTKLKINPSIWRTKGQNQLTKLFSVCKKTPISALHSHQKLLIYEK